MKQETCMITVRLPRVMATEVANLAKLRHTSVNGFILQLLSVQTGHDLNHLGVIIKNRK